MNEPKPVTIASLSDGEKPRRNFLVFGACPRQPGDEPRFISAQGEADERFGIGRVTVTKAEPPSLYATFIPIPPPEVMPRGLYADYPPESAAPSGKEGPNPDACAKCGRDSWYDLPAENGGRMLVCAVCHPGASISLAPAPAKPDSTPRERWESKCERWRMEGHACPYELTEPGIREAAAFMTREELTRECEAIGSNLTETCRKRGITLPPWSDPYAAQRDREASREFGNWARMDVSRSESRRGDDRFDDHYRARTEARAAEKRRRVLLGLDRGPDPRILLTGDLLDPRKRAR